MTPVQNWYLSFFKISFIQWKDASFIIICLTLTPLSATLNMKLPRKVTVLAQDLLQFKDRQRESSEKRNGKITGCFLLLLVGDNGRYCIMSWDCPYIPVLCQNHRLFWVERDTQRSSNPIFKWMAHTEVELTTSVLLAPCPDQLSSSQGHFYLLGSL